MHSIYAKRNVNDYVFFLFWRNQARSTHSILGSKELIYQRRYHLQCLHSPLMTIKGSCVCLKEDFKDGYITSLDLSNKINS